MPDSWTLVLAPESKLDSRGDDEDSFGDVPPIPTEIVANALEGSSILKRDGLRFRSDEIAPFELSSEGVQVIDLECSTPAPAIRLALTLAREIGPVTLADSHFTRRVEVKAGMREEEIADRIVSRAPTCGRCGRELQVAFRCLYCGWTAAGGHGPSLDPHPAAPGRPEKRILPPLGSVLKWFGILSIISIPWIIEREIHRSRDDSPPPPSSAPADPQMTEARIAIIAARLFLTSSKGRTPTAEGWIEAGPEGPGSRGRVTLSDGRTVLADPWGNPIRCIVARGAMKIYSFGPDGRDDSGKGDDIVQVFPTR